MGEGRGRDRFSSSSENRERENGEEEQRQKGEIDKRRFPKWQTPEEEGIVHSNKDEEEKHAH